MLYLVFGNMRAMLLLLPLTLQMVSGLHMCNGPFEPPELVTVNVTPAYDNFTNRTNFGITEVKITVEVMSSNPVEMLWVAPGMGCIDAKYASEDCENARSSTDVTGERHVFRLYLKLPKSTGIQNVADISRGITLRLNTVYDCNVVSFGMLLERAVELVRGNDTKLPKITQMPRQRYNVSGTGLQVITTGITLGASREPPWVRLSCSPKYRRKNGRFLRLPFAYTYGFESSVTELKSLGVTETTCLADFGHDIESVYVEIRHDVNVIDPSQGAFADTIWIKMLTEFRRPGVIKPAIMLTVDGMNPIESDGGDDVLPTMTNHTDMFCSADAASKPNIEMARVTEDGTYHYDPLTRTHLPLSRTYYKNMGSAHVSVVSPSLLGEEEYVCTATSGNDVTRRRIKLVRIEPVAIVKTGHPSVSMIKGGPQYNLSCEATGAPQPTINFYLSPTFNAPLDQFLKANRDKEIHDSDLFETSTRVEGGKTYGTVIVKDFGKVLESMTEDGILPNNAPIVACIAYNKYSSFSYREIGRYLGPEFT